MAVRRQFAREIRRRSRLHTERRYLHDALHARLLARIEKRNRATYMNGVEGLLAMLQQNAHRVDDSIEAIKLRAQR